MTGMAAPTAVSQPILAGWHLPWRAAHSSWLELGPHAQRDDELARRMSYPLWCARLGLMRELPAAIASAWASALGWPEGRFVSAVHLLGLLLKLAACRRDSLLIARDAAQRGVCGADDLRWVLQRACANPAASAVPGPWGEAHTPEQAGFLGVRHAVLHTAPALWPRLRLAFPRSWDDAPDAAAAADAPGRLQHLWQAAAQRAAGGALC